MENFFGGGGNKPACIGGVYSAPKSTLQLEVIMQQCLIYFGITPSPLHQV